jgi:hypothetical protein
LASSDVLREFHVVRFGLVVGRLVRISALAIPTVDVIKVKRLSGMLAS